MYEHEFLQSIPLYASGALSGKEKEEFERHLARGCEICEVELRIYQETAAMLVYGLPNRKLPEGLKAKIYQRIDFKQSQSIKTDWNRILRLAAAIAFIALLGSIVWWQDQQLDSRDERIREFEIALNQQKQEIAWLRDPSVQLAMLTGLQPAPGAKGKMLWNPTQSKGIFYANWLPPLPQGKSYQLWVIGAHGPVSAGVFDPNAHGSAVVTISRIAFHGGALQFAVTIEPRGGLPQPSGQMVLAGKPL
jgi:Anti-sigma-K factor rskA/Putative zinc-finger